MPPLITMDGSPKNHYIIMSIIDSCLPFLLFEAELNNSVSKLIGYLQVYNQKMGFLCQRYASICPFLGHFLGPFKGTNASRRAVFLHSAWYTNCVSLSRRIRLHTNMTAPNTHMRR